MKIAKFKRLGEGTTCSFETFGAEGCFMESHAAYIRITEYAEVEFIPLCSEDVVQKQLNALDSAETEVRNRFQEALREIERQRQELRAITVKA